MFLKIKGNPWEIPMKKLPWGFTKNEFIQEFC